MDMAYEIGCTCEKCNCGKKVPLVTCVYDSCLKENHIYRNIIIFNRVENNLYEK